MVTLQPVQSGDLVLVTGGAGFIGSNIARTLAARGLRVVVCDRLRTGGKWLNLRDIALHDLITPDEMEAWLARHAGSLAAIVHMGAISATTERDADLIAHNNIRLPLDLWAWCSTHRTRLIYASSAATYGDGALGFSDEGSVAALAGLVPLNAYGWSKHMVDRRIAADLAAGLPRPPQWAGLKFFNVYGPGEDHKGDMRSVVNKIWPVARDGGTVQLFRSHRPDFTDGGQSRDFVYVKDCAAVVAWLLEQPRVNGLFNLGTGLARSFRDLALAVFDTIGAEPRITYVDTPPAIRDKYQYFTQAEMGKLRHAGFEGQFYSLEQGVRDYIESHLALA